MDESKEDSEDDNERNPNLPVFIRFKVSCNQAVSHHSYWK